MAGDGRLLNRSGVLELNFITFSAIDSNLEHDTSPSDSLRFRSAVRRNGCGKVGPFGLVVCSGINTHNIYTMQYITSLTCSLINKTELSNTKYAEAQDWNIKTRRALKTAHTYNSWANPIAWSCFSTNLLGPLILTLHTLRWVIMLNWMVILLQSVINTHNGNKNCCWYLSSGWNAQNLVHFSHLICYPAVKNSGHNF